MSCGSDGGGGDDNNNNNNTTPDGETVTLNLRFSPMYSAFDGVHEFRVPVIASGATGAVTFTAADSSMVDVVPTAEGAMLRTLKAGNTTITGTAADGSRGTARLYITQADPADWELGRERYNSGIAAFDFGDGGMPPIMMTDGGMPMGMPNFTPDPESACTFCHKPEGTGTTESGIPIDVEHTPQQIGGYSDEQLVTIFTKGEKPAGVGMRVFPSAEGWKRLHQWSVDESVQKGIIVYVRSLEPKEQGELDFGGVMGRPPGAPGAGGGADAGTATPGASTGS